MNEPPLVSPPPSPLYPEPVGSPPSPESPAKGLAVLMIVWGGWMLLAGDAVMQANQDAQFYNERVQGVIDGIDRRIESLPQTMEWQGMTGEEQEGLVKSMRNATQSLEVVRLSTAEIAEMVSPVHQGLRLLNVGIGLAWIGLGLMVLVDMPQAALLIPRLALATLGLTVGGWLLVKGWLLRTIGTQLAQRIDAVWAASDPTHAPSTLWQGMVVGQWTTVNVLHSIWPTLVWAGLAFFTTRPRREVPEAGMQHGGMSQHGL